MATRYPGDPYTKADRALARSVAQEYLGDLEATGKKDTTVERRRLKTMVIEAMLKKYQGIEWFGPRHADYMIKEYGGVGAPQPGANLKRSGSRPRARRSCTVNDINAEELATDRLVHDADSPRPEATLEPMSVTTTGVGIIHADGEYHDDSHNMDDTIMVALSPFLLPHTSDSNTAVAAMRFDDDTILHQPSTVVESSGLVPQNPSAVASPKTLSAVNNTSEEASLPANSDPGEAIAQLRPSALRPRNSMLTETPPTMQIAVPQSVSLVHRLTEGVVDEIEQSRDPVSLLEPDAFHESFDHLGEHNVRFRAELARHLIDPSAAAMYRAPVNSEDCRGRATLLLSSTQLMNHIRDIMDQSVDQYYANLGDLSNKHFASRKSAPQP